MPKVLKADGQWYEGKAAPEHLREDLRALPSEFVTKNTSDPDKIHELDAPHIVAALTEEQFKAQQDKPTEAPLPEEFIDKKLKGPNLNNPGPLNQFDIDCMRMKAIQGLIKNAMNKAARGELELALQILSIKTYLWFPKNKVTLVESRVGHAPPDSERPKHLKRFELWVDPFNWPRSIRDVLEAKEVEVPSKLMLENQLLELQERFVQQQKEDALVAEGLIQ